MDKCMLKNCDNDVYPEHEIDVSIAIMSSPELSICMECYNSRDPKIITEIEELININNGKLPFCD